MQEKFVENLEYVYAYINVKKFGMNRITCRFPVIPCGEVIEWIITHMDGSHFVLRSESGGQFATYYGEDI